MNFLTHAAIATDALCASGTDRHMAIVGAVAPDLSGRLRFRRAGHFGGRILLKKVKEEAPDWMPFALGLITHGNDPPAVDSLCHGPDGIITRLIEPLVETAEKDDRFHRVFRQPVWWHLMTEMVSDYLLLRGRPVIVEQVTEAFDNIDMARAAALYAGAFNLDSDAVERNLARIRKWHIDYYLDADRYHFMFHRVWRRLKRGETIPEDSFRRAFESALKLLEVEHESRYHELLSAARYSVAAFSGISRSLDARNNE
ncbi:MAG: hypothetical protein ACYS8W_09325 [Planctomycetota bacterium]|jgi:hypothetical protein